MKQLILFQFIFILLLNDVVYSFIQKHFQLVIKRKTNNLVNLYHDSLRNKLGKVTLLRDSSPSNPPIEPSGSRQPKNNNSNQKNIPMIGGMWPRDKTSAEDNNENNIIDYNWKYGMCEHKVPFEGAQVIRRLKFCGDLLSFSFTDGKVCLIRISTGEILNKFNQHNGIEVTGLDFDGIHLCSGSADGTVCFYILSYNESKKFGNYSHKFNQLHNNAITGLKLVTIRHRTPAVTSISNTITNITNTNTSGNTSSVSMGSKNVANANNTSSSSSSSPITSAILSPLQEELVYVVSCSLDRKLICMDFNSGQKVYETVLPGVPLCMDINSGYIAVGLSDGRVIFYKASTGVQLLFFHTKYSKVRSIFLLSSSVLFTGSDDGRITRWDLSGGSSSDTKSTAATSPTAATGDINTSTGTSTGLSSSATAGSGGSDSESEVLLKAFSQRPTRVLDYYFLEASLQATAALRNSNTFKHAFNFNNINNNNNLITNSNNSSSNGNSVNKNGNKPAAVKDSNFDNSNGATMVYTDKRHKGSPVVSVQGDADKVLAAYADGTVTAWETNTGEHLFDLKGRTKFISTVQYDRTRLIADGAHSAVVMHDFAPTLTPRNDSSDELQLVLDNYHDIDDEEEEEDNNSNNNNNDKYQ